MAWALSVVGWLGGILLLLPALGLVPPPENVKMNSVNFKNILQWESPAFPEENLTFTAQYESYWHFQDRCKNIASTQCDFSVLSMYGDHVVRVRAEFADEHSEWVNITFCPVDDTIIGAPGMQVESLADSLHMRFSAPQIENEPETWTMKNIYNSWAYRVQYWKNGTTEKFQVISPYDSEVLRNLAPWTTYCIQVQGFLLDQNRTGEWSEPICERTTNDALGLIPPPENVKMNSVNFKNILQWESPAFPEENLTFTAQYESYWHFQDHCKNIASTQCDFSVLSMYGDHVVRVRAEFADEHSEWVNITFCPVDDTIIGAPRMQVESLADSLHMRFSAPQIENEPETWTMKNIYNSWAYRVQYWKNGTTEKFQVISPYDSEVLRNLVPWTTYCIQVQGFLLDRNRTGEWSEPICERTTNDETTPSWRVAILLITSVFVAFLSLLGCFGLLWFIYKKAKYTFHSGTSLPQHLKEFLGHPHHNNTFLLLSSPLSDETEVFDKVSVITEESKGSKQNPGDSCALGTPCEPGPQELESEDEAPSPAHSDPLFLTLPQKCDWKDQLRKPQI